MSEPRDVFLEANRLRHHLLEWGSGERVVLLLHGFQEHAHAWDFVAPSLAAAGFRVLALDWRGHGGFVAIELYRALGPVRVPKLVLVDWIVTAAPPPFLAALAALQDASAWAGVRDKLFAMWLEGVDDEAVRRFVADDMGAYDGAMWARAAREIAAAFARVGSPLAALAALAPPPPTLHVYAQPRDPAYLEAQQAFAAAHPWFTVERIEARSHFPTLEAPARVAAAVERFLG